MSKRFPGPVTAPAGAHRDDAERHGRQHHHIEQVLELVALDCGAVGPEPQDRFLDDEHELPVPLEQVALPADPLGGGPGDVVDFHAALLADLGQNPGHVRGGLQQPRQHFGLVGPEQPHAFPHVAGQHLLGGVQASSPA